jgi:acyl-CoA dehydrogenase
MDARISDALREEVHRVREWGREEARPAGLEADRNAAPLPVDHPFFDKCIKTGRGRTSWQNADREDDLKIPEGRVVRRVVLAEELSYWDRGIGVATPGVGLPESIVIGSGTEEQKQRFLGPFKNPERPKWASFALTEPTGGSDTAAFRTRARRDGDHWVLNGAKCFIGNAGRADWILVQATTDPSGGRAAQRAFFVEKGTPGIFGFRIEKKMGLRAYESTSFSLEDCRIPAENVLGGEREEKKRGEAYKETMGNLNTNRAGVAANAIGIARAALDEAVKFAQEQELFALPRVRDRLEEAQRKLRSAWLLVLKAAWLADQRKANIVESSICKVVAAETAQDIAAAGMEILGVTGGRGDHLIEKLYRDAKAMNIVEGTGQIQRMIVARQLVGLPR